MLNSLTRVLGRDGKWRAPKKRRPCPPHVFSGRIRGFDAETLEPYEDVYCVRCFKFQ